MNTEFQLFPDSASSAAVSLDHLMFALVLLTSSVALLLAALMVVFCIRYRKDSAASRVHAPATGRRIEIAWTAAPLLVFLGMYAWSAYDYLMLYRIPADAIPVFVVAKQWMWKLEHTNGKREVSELHVPLGKPIRLVMTSQDVIHSFYAPAFRIKQDVVPGRYTSIWFTPTKAGEYHLLCAEYCGTEHSVMRGRIVVMPPAEYARWLEQGTSRPGIVRRGFELYRSHGCSGCHEAGSQVHAPDLHGLPGRVVHLQDGRSLIADENYIRDSILLPGRDVVAGYQPIMPSFAGQLGEEDLMAIIEYLRQTGERDASARR